MTLVIQTTQFVSFPIIFEIISNVVLQFSGWDRLEELAKKILDPLKKISLEIYTTDFFLNSSSHRKYSLLLLANNIFKSRQPKKLKRLLTWILGIISQWVQNGKISRILRQKSTLQRFLEFFLQSANSFRPYWISKNMWIFVAF